MTRGFRLAAGALALAGLVTAVGFVTRPPVRIALARPSTPGPPMVRGAFHVHTVRSDGTGTLDEVAAAARKAGLDFVIVADHGDGTRTTGLPSYRSGVLCLEVVELSTAQGHFAAIGLPPVPYPLRGDPEDVVEDVRRLGGFGIVTHPTSPKAELSWHAWDAPIDGLEWVNADSEWRDERWPSLAAALWRYPWRSTEALAALVDDTLGALSRWDRLTVARPVVALAGVDAHGGLAVERQSEDTGEYSAKPVLRVPSYLSLFRLFDNLVLLARPWTGDAAYDAAELVQAIRQGRVSSAVSGLAAPAWAWLSVSSGESVAWMGETIRSAGGALRMEVVTNAPAGSRLFVKRNGRVVLTGSGPTLTGELPSGRGAVRAEVRLPSRIAPVETPWAVTNPVYIDYAVEPAAGSMPRWTAAAPAEGGRTVGGDPGGWQIERDPSSRASWVPSGGTAAAGGVLSVSLGHGGPTRSPYGALAVGVGRATFRSGDAVEFEARADRPCRLSVQVRAADVSDDRRWRRSVYVDGVTRTYRVPLAALRGVASAAPPVAADLGAVDSLLFVVDTVNLDPGDSRTLVLTHPRRVEAQPAPAR